MWRRPGSDLCVTSKPSRIRLLSRPALIGRILPRGKRGIQRSWREGEKERRRRRREGENDGEEERRKREMMQYTKNQIERDIAIIATDRDLLPSQGHGPGRIRIQSRIHIREGIHIVNITIIFLFVEVHMSFLARSLFRGLSIRSSPFYAANMRWFSDMTEEQRVGLHLMCNE